MSDRSIVDNHPISLPSTTASNMITSEAPLLVGNGGGGSNLGGNESNSSTSDSPRPPMLTLPNEVPETASTLTPPVRSTTNADVRLRVNPSSPTTPPPETGESRIDRKPSHSPSNNGKGINGNTESAGNAAATRTLKKVQVTQALVEGKNPSNRRSVARSKNEALAALEKDAGSLHYRFGYGTHGEKLPLFQAIKIHVQKNWVLNPNTNTRWYWNLIIFFIMIFYVIEIPLRLGFRVNNCPLCATTILHLLIDIFFLIDCLFLQTRTSYFTDDINQIVLEPHPLKIFKNYCAGWFAVDFLTSIPIQFILQNSYDLDDPKNVYLSAFVQFCYLFRLLKVIRFMDLLHYYNSVEISAGTVMADALKILKFVFGFFVIAHISACMWMFIAIRERKDTSVSVIDSVWDVRTWPGNLGYTLPGNATEVLMRFGGDDTAYGYPDALFDSIAQTHLMSSVQPLTVDLSYLMALYWSVSTMTTVGYGDIIPRNDTEIAYACLVIFIGAVTFGYIISNVSTIIQIEDDADTKIRDKITSINAYMAYRKLPPDLQKKIRNHYEYQWKRKTVYDEKEILQHLPTYLRTRVALYLNQDLIRNVAFLRDLGSDCLALLVTELRPCRVGAGYWIFKQGSLGREMCFVHEGMVEVLGKKNKQLAVLQKGAYFGEISILSDQPTKRSASVRALTATDLFALTKESFDEILKVYPELKAEVQAHADARLREAMSGKQEREITKHLSPQEGITSDGAVVNIPPTPSNRNNNPRTPLMAPHDSPMTRPTSTASLISPGTAATHNPNRPSISTLGFNPYAALPHSRLDEIDDETKVLRTVLKGKEMLETMMHPELANEIALESQQAQAALDAQLAAEQEFFQANKQILGRAINASPLRGGSSLFTLGEGLGIQEGDETAEENSARDQLNVTGGASSSNVTPPVSASISGPANANMLHQTVRSPFSTVMRRSSKFGRAPSNGAPMPTMATANTSSSTVVPAQPAAAAAASLSSTNGDEISPEQLVSTVKSIVSAALAPLDAQLSSMAAQSASQQAQLQELDQLVAGLDLVY